MAKMKYTPEMLSQAVSESISYREVCRRLGMTLTGNQQTHIKNRIQKLGIDTSHFLGVAANRGKVSNRRYLPEEILIKTDRKKGRTPAYRLRRALLEVGVPNKCGICLMEPIWCNQPLVFQIDHKDGDWANNLVENLRFICGNCHIQTETYGNKSAHRPTCFDCGIAISSRKWNRCRSCATRAAAQGKTKIDWPSLNEVQELVRKLGYLGAGRKLGVSDNAVRKFLQRQGGEI